VWLGIAASSAYCKSKMVSDETLVFACSRLILNKLPSNRKLMGIPAFEWSPFRKTRVTATRNRLKMTGAKTQPCLTPAKYKISLTLVPVRRHSSSLLSNQFSVLYS